MRIFLTGLLHFPFRVWYWDHSSIVYPLLYSLFKPLFLQWTRRLLEASCSLGRSSVYTFFRVILPLSRHGIITGCVLSFAHTLGEFGVILMIGGNIPGVTRVASVAIYDEVQALNYGSCQHVCSYFIESFHLQYWQPCILLIEDLYVLCNEKKLKVTKV